MFSLLLRFVSVALPFLKNANLNDSSQMREVMRSICKLLSTVADKTSTLIDDACVSVLNAVVSDDTAWQDVWNLFHSSTDMTKTALNSRLTAVVSASAPQVQTGSIASSVVSIVAALKAFIELIEWLRTLLPTPQPSPDSDSKNDSGDNRAPDVPPTPLT